ncbi:hypothetical protein [Streptomyces sp. NBC_00140]|uniref:DUF6907 domain-containing protein n=1 Tax=Streptomyces sp. NBC_00140 TaxID=2975664 RepID=UPI0022523B69|nr:hypothetical protein [Streptomyces sp. NBC_00140]MCX5336911.1 hypothetical protein [Streptomyces sp. NBC_00140]MCX5338394.1 hypothetical protein [Streptomyces sp. NBC_00140]
MTVAIPAQIAPEASVTPAAPRIRPALVNGLQIFIECPEWCTDDHVAENERHLEDICHGGRMADLMLPGPSGELDLMAFARLSQETCGSEEQRRPRVTVDDRAAGAYLLPDEADVFADGLVSFAEQIRAMVQVARGQ